MVSKSATKRPNVPPPNFLLKHKIPLPRPDLQVIYPVPNLLHKRDTNDHNDNIAMDSEKRETKITPVMVSS